MSRIINQLKKHKRILVMVAFVILSVFAVVFRLYIIAVVILVGAFLNDAVIRKMNRQKEPFGPRSHIRNVDSLIIGDVSDNIKKNLSGDGTRVCIHIPDCSLVAAYEVLRHTFSILKECGGTAIIIVSQKNIEGKFYSIFDAGFYHIVTLNRLKLKKYINRGYLPIIFAPLRSIKFLFGIGLSEVKEIEMLPKEMEEFCMEREIALKILTAKKR